MDRDQEDSDQQDSDRQDPDHQDQDRHDRPSAGRRDITRGAGEDRGGTTESGAAGTLRIAVDNAGAEAGQTGRDLSEQQSGVVDAAVREIRDGLAKIEGTIARISDPTAKTLMQVARADLVGTLADLTDDPETSVRYGRTAQQIPIGAQDLRVHGARVRERFEAASRHLRDEARRIGLDLAVIGARLSLGRPISAGQVRDWETSDLARTLGQAGKTRETASQGELDRAKTVIARFNDKILETYGDVVAALRQKVRRELGREAEHGAGRDRSIERARAGQIARHDRGISL